MYERIKALAKEHGWSMSYLASKINRSSAYFTDVKNGKATIPDDKLKEIANYLNCSVDYLLGRVDNPHSEIPVALSAPQGYENLTDEQKELIQALIDQYAQKNKEK